MEIISNSDFNLIESHIKRLRDATDPNYERFKVVADVIELGLNLARSRQERGDPTAFADGVAAEMRQYYEVHKESWWANKFRRQDVSDNLMLNLLSIVQREYDV